ncbi:MAG: DUF2997 domain-containing protein [Sedimentisphaerales bacterium]|jgi:acylphosphatase|nr:DUF2997 domain-containing protein [Sedimentisphaerales bacterium]
MAQHQIEIVISKDGQVKVHVKGAKGKACVEYAKWLAEVVGKIKSQQLTSEYYEPDSKAGIDLHQQAKG